MPNVRAANIITDRAITVSEIKFTKINKEES
jgi:hypothetical protein